MQMKTDYNEALAKALILRAKRSGLEGKMEAMLYSREIRALEATQQERVLVTTWADIVLYGNWPF